MKKKVVSMVVVMAFWAAGFYALGRHHGTTKGAMALPTVKLQWPAEKAEPPKKVEAASVEEVDLRAISDAVCAGEPLPEKTVAKAEAKDAKAAEAKK